jgi:CHAT domain-containing protein
LAGAWQQETAKVLLIGDPLQADRNFPPLRYAQQEIQAIISGFPDCKRYTGADAYPQKFRESGPSDFQFIHFTSHADANAESPLNSAVILSKHNDVYKLYARDVLDQRLHAGLVTISACSSAGAKAYSGEGLMGFSWAFLEAGAHNVIAGIWNVDDATAPVFMRALYKGLAEGQAPAEALRAAKLASLRLYRKPYYWAPFQVFTRYVQRGNSRLGRG